MQLEKPPKLIAVTIDHGLRKESAREARAVARLAKTLNVEHVTLRWTGRKPKTGIQEAARNARYRLLSEEAHRQNAMHILTAHTLDDQAETLLFRMARGSGVSGLVGMRWFDGIPVSRREAGKLGQAIARCAEGAAHRDAESREDRLLGRPLEFRSALHAASPAQTHAIASARGADG